MAMNGFQKTSMGDIRCERVNCGHYAQRVEMFKPFGSTVRWLSASHQYFLTEEIKEIGNGPKKGR
jgi:hypothetical protein